MQMFNKLSNAERHREVKRSRLQAAARGWTNLGTPNVIFLGDLPPRQNAKWNDKEAYDLLKEYTGGQTLKFLAKKHGRNISALEQKLAREKLLFEQVHRHIKSLS